MFSHAYRIRDTTTTGWRIQWTLPIIISSIPGLRGHFITEPRRRRRLPVPHSAGLEEGIVNGSTTVFCNGEFDTVTPSPRCWIHPGGHGSLGVVGAIENSCNIFFYTIGYELGLDSAGNYDSDLGTDALAKYAEMYGLGEKSGVEIDEAEPEISDEYSVQSAIGQGTNNFTVSQLNRYVTAVANRGTVYDLTLVDRITDSDGNLLRDNEAEVASTMDDISSSTWDMIHEGMQRMVSSHATFSDIGFSMAGKTGTAQQNSLHPDHALFVGYAPADTPEIAIATRITYGYNSGYASEIGRDVARLYFDPDLKDRLITGRAADLGSEMAGD